MNTQKYFPVPEDYVVSFRSEAQKLLKEHGTALSSMYESNKDSDSQDSAFQQQFAFFRSELQDLLNAVLKRTESQSEIRKQRFFAELNKSFQNHLTFFNNKYRRSAVA